MARKPRRKASRRNFVAIPFRSGFNLSTLADGAVLKNDVMTMGEDIFILSMDTMDTIRAHTAGEGPIEVGWAHGDLSVAEIAEYLDADLTDPDDIIQKERASRPVRSTGIFPGLATNEALNHGNKTRTKIMKSLGNGHTFSLWARNLSGATLTTGNFVSAVGKLYGKWQR